jgi:hypothetical protein
MIWFVLLGCFCCLNLWMTRRVIQAGPHLDHKGLLVAGIWLMPGLGTFIARNHLRAYAPEEAAGTAATHPDSAAGGAEPAPEQLSVPGGPVLPLRPNISLLNGFPVMDWPAVAGWINAHAPEDLRTLARNEIRRAWLLHLRDALGPHYWLHEATCAYVLSPLERKAATATAEYVAKTRHRVTRVLNRLAALPPGEKSILLVMDDDAAYYRYVAGYYPAEGEFAFSGGMFIDAGCPHFIVKQADLTQVEPVIAHELTHSAVSHLDLPLWLDEGLAVNTQHKLAGASPGLHTPHELHAMHQRFWGEAEIQQFWTGASFQRPDDGNMLSYDLARILVEQMARSWEHFEDFVLHARREDAGAAAARQHLGIDLSAYVCALLEREPSPEWAPRGRCEPHRGLPVAPPRSQVVHPARLGGPCLEPCHGPAFFHHRDPALHPGRVGRPHGFHPPGDHAGAQGPLHVRRRDPGRPS